MKPAFVIATNIVLFQMGWLACVLLPDYWFLVATALILSIHLLLIVPAGSRLDECFLLTTFFVVGFVIESIYLHSGIMLIAGNPLLPPLWLLLLWVLFATTCRYSLRWLSSRFMFAIVFAAIGAPLSYYFGVQLRQDVLFNPSLPYSLFMISASWAVVFPILLIYTVRKPLTIKSIIRG